VQYFVAPNLSRRSRDAKITVAEQTYQIKQDGLPDDEGERVSVDGRVSELSGQCPALQFVVKSRVVRTSAETNFEKGSCSDLTSGRDVAVEGIRRADGSIDARVVELKK
jgi:hypothetical protein